MPPRPPAKPAFIPKTPQLAGGYMRLRNGIWQHIKDGRITGNDFNVYLTIHHFADWRTGICYSNAVALAEAWGDLNSVKNKVETFQNSMRHLRAGGYIDYPENGHGKGKSYPILIDKAEPNIGPLTGWRLRLVAGENDFANPMYQYNSPTPWEEVYGDIQVSTQAVTWRNIQVNTPGRIQVNIQAYTEADTLPTFLPLLDILDISRPASKPVVDRHNPLSSGAAGRVVSLNGKDYTDKGRAVESEESREPGTSPATSFNIEDEDDDLT